MSLPAYNHNFTSELINYYDGLPEEKIDEGLALPRQTFIEDLEKFITDLQTRREYYYTEVSESYYLLSYALNFLSILEAKESLPKFLEILNEDEKFTDYWFSEFLEPSYIAFLYYPFFKDNFDVLLELIINKKNNVVHNGLINIPAQVALKEPSRREEAIDFYKSLIEFIVKLDKKNSQFDDVEIDTLIHSIFLIEGKALQEQVLQLYDKKLVDEMFFPKERVIKKFEQIDRYIKSNLKLKLDFTPYEIFENSLGGLFTYKLTTEEKEKLEEEFRKKVQQMEIEEFGEDKNDYLPTYYDPKTDKPMYQRNDKINVKYKDGKIVENVKYKKVEKDIKEGKCEIVS